MPKIFIIDDDKDLLHVVKSLLAKRGFSVSTFIDWEIANDMIKKQEPQLILLDVFLSGIDGLDICKKLKASPYTKHIPILLFSAFPKIAESGIHDYGADDFIAKPFEVGDLIKKGSFNVINKRSLCFRNFLKHLMQV
jgi:Response regulators consisting of a CheY-like receiver domain and a winged-helix DNA-binding domain